MPAAPRPKGNARKIFEKVMGKPKNASDKKKDGKRKIKEKLVFEETSLVR